MKHELTLNVNASCLKCYQVWYDRLNWMEWFGVIDEVRCEGRVAMLPVCVWAPSRTA